MGRLAVFVVPNAEVHPFTVMEVVLMFFISTPIKKCIKYIIHFKYATLLIIIKHNS